MLLQEKLNRVLTSATSLFIVPGFADTKMVDIAKNANLAVGTLYSLFKGKDDLLEFVFSTTLDPTIIDHVTALPVHTEAKTCLVSRTKQVYQREAQNLNHIITNTSDQNQFKSLLAYLSTTFDRYGTYFLILEHNPKANPELVTLYKRYRKNSYEKVTALLTTLMNTHQIRLLPCPGNDAMIIIDELFWWSAHKKYDSFEFYNNNFIDASFRKSIIAQLSASYLI